MRRRSGRPGAASEAGSATVFMVCFALALIMVAGLVFDGGLALAAKRRAINVAEQAARTGAQELSIASVRGTGPVRLDPDAARQAAHGYLGAAGYSGTVRVRANTVEVTVDWSRSSTILGIAGIGGFGGTGTASAINCRGVVQEEEC